MSSDLWFGPNVDSDFQGLMDRPEEWVHARSNISTLQVYIQNVEALAAGGFFKALQEAGLDLTIEAGAVKDWSLDGRNAAWAILRAIEQVRSTGGEVQRVVLDEPLGAMQANAITRDQTVEATCHVINRVRAVGVREVGLIEPYPYCSADDIVAFMEAVQQAGSSPSFLHLDVDRYGIKDQRIKPAQACRDHQLVRGRCFAWGIPFGIVVFGQRAGSSEAVYRQSVLDWLPQMKYYCGGLPDRVIVQSWEIDPASGKLTMPHNAPETDRTSHTALVSEVARFVGFDKSPTLW